MSRPVFTGVGVALITLFDGDGTVDAAATATHARRLVDLGMRAVVVSGTTGEASALSADEQAGLLAAVAAAVGGRVPVVAGVRGSSVDAAALAKRAVGEGAAAVLALSPAGGIAEYYGSVAEAAGDAPVLAYHFPAVSPPGIPVELLARLPVAGVKDSTGDAERLTEELHGYAGPVYVGSSALLSLAGPLGAAGAILGLANVAPEDCIAAFDGDSGAQRRLLDGHVASRDRFPLGLKRLVADRFGTSATVRA